MTNDTDGQAQPALWEGVEYNKSQTGTARSASQAASTGRRPTTPTEFSDLWTIAEVANYLGVPKQTVYCWRSTGYGPQGFRVGKHLRWRAETVIAWTLEMEHRQ